MRVERDVDRRESGGRYARDSFVESRRRWAAAWMRRMHRQSRMIIPVLLECVDELAMEMRFDWKVCDDDRMWLMKSGMRWWVDR